ncbi:MAG: peroxidase-related enzyme [Pseudomonadota bacterium]
MARIPQITDDAATGDAADLFTAIKAKVGMVPNLYRVAANQPAALKAMLGIGETLGGGNFDPKTREAIALAVAGANGCDYCASAHSAISANLKVEAEEIASRLAGHSTDPRVDAIVKLAVKVNDTKGFVADNDLADAKAAGLSDADIVEVVANVAQNVFTNYLNHVADTDIDFPVVKAKAA